MLPSDDEGFKGEICKTAEDAVDRMFLETPNQDVLSSTAASVLILQQCREKLAALAAAIPQLDAGRPAWPRSRRGGASNAAVAQYRTDESALCRPGVPDINTRGSAESTPNVAAPVRPSKPDLPALSLPKCQISPARVVSGTPYVVKLLRGGPPSKFWLRLENSCSEKIDTDLELFYSSAQPLNFIPALGSYVVCSYSQKFHRGKVVTSYQCHDEPTKLEVILVDSGGIATVKYNQVYQIEDCFCQETAQGLFCSVFDLEPADGTWEVDAVSLFMSLCDNLVATFHPPPSESREPFSKYQTDYSVSLRCIRDDKVCDVGSLLVQNAMAKPKTNQRELNVSADSATSAVKSSISIKDIAKMNVAHEAPAETDVDNERVVRPVDELLMQQFFDSLTITPKQPDRSLDSETRSFVTAASFNPRDTEPSSLQYEYGAVLAPRPLPVLDSSTDVNVMKLSVSHINSPTHFYAHLQDEEPVFQDLATFLNETYEQSKPVPVARPDVGSFWVARSETSNAWVRVEITGVQPAAQTEPVCSVFHVDSGLVEGVPVSNLRPLVTEILDTPCIALRCRLTGIHPYLGSPGFGEWSLPAIEKFKELMETQVESTALINPETEEEGCVSVILLYNDSDENYTINEMLVGLRLASSLVFTQVAEPGFDDWDPMYDDYHSTRNNLQLDPENYDSVTAGYVPQDEKAICRFFRANGRCRRGIRCNQLHVQPNPKGFTHDRTLVFVDVPSLQDLPVGGLVSVQVTCVMNGYRFFAVLPLGTRDLGSASSDTDEPETLATLQDALQKEYNEALEKHRCFVSPSVGDLVVARSPEDDRWYRARIVLDSKDELYGVFFIDYGNCQEVHLRHICRPLPRFVHLPAQAVEMYLNGVERSPDSRSAEARNMLIELVKERDLVARIVFNVPYVCVDLYDTTGTEHIDVAAYLVKQKLVLPAPKVTRGNINCGVQVIAG